MEQVSSKIIKGYELGERVGAGGFGAVYRAVQSTVGREVAIKIILPGFANQPEFVRRFETEAQLIARLEHMNITPLYDYWRDPEGAYLVMRFLRGGSLKDALQQGPYDLETTALLLGQVASALSVAHRNQIIHRDIKPANILLDEDGNAYMADFGIAKDVGNATGLATQEGGVVGSPDYLSPEQVRNEPVTPQSDIYSLGIVLYEMLTGSHPYPDLTPVERMFKHLDEPVPKLTVLDQNVSAAIDEVVQKATAKNPKDRYEDILAMATAFREAAGLSVSQAAKNLVELLTPREQEVLKLIMEGKSNREIADKLTVELTTIKWYITQIYRKLNVRSRVQAIVRARELNLIVGGRQTADTTGSSISTLPEPENPYKGLRSFQAADEQDFFGREKLTMKLLSRIGQNGDHARFLAVVGPSGSGKSSLVKAGMIPALWRGELPGSERWYSTDMVPGGHPLDELEVALIHVAAQRPDNLREQLERDARGLVRTAQIILPDDDSELVIVIDQFEEVFTLVEDEAQRTHFLDLLQTAVTDPKSRVRVVVTLRADFYDRPLQYPAFGDLVRSRMETVLPLSSEELERAIVGPAQRVGVKFEEGLVASIVSDVNYQPGALPLLQYALTELFEGRENRTLTHESYQKIGRATGALASRAEQVYAEMDEASHEAVRQMFLRLVTLGEGIEDTRRRVFRSELLAIASDPDLMDEVIDTYAAYRLLALDHDPSTRTPTVEVAHEAILREWERLRQWLNESRADIRLQRILAAAAKEWLQADWDPGFLLRGSRLDQFEGWAASTDVGLTQNEQAFVEASLAARQARRTNEAARQQRELETAQKLAETERQRAEEQAQATGRLRRRAVFLTGALVVAGILAVVAVIFGQQASRNEQNALAQQAIAEAEAEQRATAQAIAEQEREIAEQQREEAEKQANLATSRELSLAALNNLESDPELSMLLALQALGTSYTKEAEEALRRGLQASRILMTLADNTGTVWAAIYSPDGSHIATGSDDGTIKVWEAASGQLLHTMPFSGVHFMGQSLAFDETGYEVAVVTYGNNFESIILHSWNVGSGELLSQIKLPIPMIFGEAAALSPDWQWIAAGSENGTVELWEVETAEKLLTLSGHDDKVGLGVSFSPDGSRLVTASINGQVQVWDVEASVARREGQLIVSFATQNNARLLRTFFNADGSQLAIGFLDGPIEVWDLADISQPKFILPVGFDNIAFHPDNTYLATGGDWITMWDLTTGEKLFTVSGHKGTIRLPDFSPDGSRLLAGADDGKARVWNVKPHAEGEILTFVAAHSPSDLELSPDERKVALGSDSGPATVWDAITGEQLMVLPGNPDTAVYRVAFHPDGSRLATVGEDGLVRIWDAETGELLLRFTGHTEGSSAGSVGTLDVEYSPDGSQLATAGADKLAKVWDAETGEELMILAGHTVGLVSLEYSPDGRYLATSSDSIESSESPSDNNVKIWDVHTGEEVYTLGPNPQRAWSLAFSPDGHLLATSGSGGFLSVWDMTTGKKRIDLTGQSDSIGSVAFTPDGQRLVSGGGESASIWDLATGTELVNLAPKDNWRIALTEDGRQLYAADYDTGAVRVYAVPLEDAVALAQSRLTRSLTEEECRQYLHVEECPAGF